MKPLIKDDAIASTNLTTQSHSIDSDELNLRCNPFEANTMLLDSTVAFAKLAVAVSIARFNRRVRQTRRRRLDNTSVEP